MQLGWRRGLDSIKLILKNRGREHCGRDLQWACDIIRRAETEKQTAAHLYLQTLESHQLICTYLDCGRKLDTMARRTSKRHTKKIPGEL